MWVVVCIRAWGRPWVSSRVFSPGGSCVRVERRKGGEQHVRPGKNIQKKKMCKFIYLNRVQTYKCRISFVRGRKIMKRSALESYGRVLRNGASLESIGARLNFG